MSTTTMAAASSGFSPGWGFRKHSSHGGMGFPPLPSRLGFPTYNTSRSTVAYFLGNDTGLNSDDELRAQSKFGIVGIGWQIAMRSTDWQHMEASELATAAALKRLDPSTVVLVSRNTEVGSCQFDSIHPLLVPPGPMLHPNFWVTGQPGGSGCQSGTVCNDSWTCPNCGPHGSDAVPYGKLWFNWTDADMTAWWLTSYITPALSEDNIDGVYFDCSCGSAPGLAPGSEVSFMAAAQVGFDRHLPVATAEGKVSLAWLGERVDESSCFADVQRLLSVYGSAANETFQLQYNNDRANFNQTLAAFLLIRQEYATFLFAVIGPYECASEPCGAATRGSTGFGPYTWEPELEMDYGEPLEQAVEGPAGVFTRRWSRGTVSLDCNHWTATL
jgi:hypothetical protein